MGEATHTLLPGCNYFADVDAQFVAVDICLLPHFSLRTPSVGDKVGTRAQPLRRPPRQDGGCILLVTQVLALEHILGVLAKQVPWYRCHIDHSGESRERHG